MKRKATVVNDGGRLVAEIRRSDACGHCHACGLGTGDRVLYELPEGKYNEGDEVYIEAPVSALRSATLWAYGLPLICLIAGLLLGTLVFSAEWAQALCAIISLALGYTSIKLTEKKRRASGAFECKATNAAQQKED